MFAQRFSKLKVGPQNHQLFILFEKKYSSEIRGKMVYRSPSPTPKKHPTPKKNQLVKVELSMRSEQDMEFPPQHKKSWFEGRVE